ncbi:transposase [Streptomyces sp. WM6378]|uniref:transposase n=1 Tax=Streptomyces sp. WM6378 TaxID=1415557 RepID=UPI000D1489F0|nr:transposase [Streptomyces sp. WM6378]
MDRCPGTGCCGTIGAHGRRLDHPASGPLTQDEAQQLKAVQVACPALEQTHQLVRDSGEMLTTRTSARLPDWIDAACAVALPGITGFARGLSSDLEAVVAGPTLHWSSGGTEGAAARIKKIKMQLYGRAGFALLRKMILLQGPSTTGPQDRCQSHSGPQPGRLALAPPRVRGRLEVAPSWPSPQLGSGAI